MRVTEEGEEQTDGPRVKTGEVVARFVLKGRLCISLEAFLTVGKQSSGREREREQGMMNVMEGEGEIMKVEKASLHQVGYVPSQA